MSQSNLNKNSLCIDQLQCIRLFAIDAEKFLAVQILALHYGAMSDDVWLVTRGDGTQRIEVLYECYEKIEWLDFDELK